MGEGSSVRGRKRPPRQLWRLARTLLVIIGSLLILTWVVGLVTIIGSGYGVLGPTAQQKEYTSRKLALLGPAPKAARFKSGMQARAGAARQQNTAPSSDIGAYPFAHDAKYRIYSTESGQDKSARCRNVGICDFDREQGSDGLQHIVKAEERRDIIKQATKWTWQGYRKYAWGTDELDAGGKTGTEWFRIGLTIVDGVDTLMILGLHEEAQEARQWIANHLDLEGRSVSVFESTIRILGGLVSAFYHSGGDQLYLDKALEFAERILPAFDTMTGLPRTWTQLGKRVTDITPLSSSSSPQFNTLRSGTGSTNFAEAGTLSMEFSALSHVTGIPMFRDNTMLFWAAIQAMPNTDGLYCTSFEGDSLRCTGYQYSMGAASDSTYEYMLKQWILSAGKDKICLNLYRHAMQGLRKHLLVHVRTAQNPEGSLTLSEVYGEEIFGPDGETEVVVARKSIKLEHLTCFVPGMLALGHMYGQRTSKYSHTEAVRRRLLQQQQTAAGSKFSSPGKGSTAGSTSGTSVLEEDDDLLLAVKLMRSCYDLYTAPVSGVSYDSVVFEPIYPKPPPPPPNPPNPPNPPPSPPWAPLLPAVPNPPHAPPLFPPVPPGGKAYVWYGQFGYRDAYTNRLIDPRTGQYAPQPPPSPPHSPTRPPRAPRHPRLPPSPPQPPPTPPSPPPQPPRPPPRLPSIHPPPPIQTTQTTALKATTTGTVQGSNSASQQQDAVPLASANRLASLPSQLPTASAVVHIQSATETTQRASSGSSASTSSATTSSGMGTAHNVLSSSSNDVNSTSTRQSSSHRQRKLTSRVPSRKDAYHKFVTRYWQSDDVCRQGMPIDAPGREGGVKSDTMWQLSCEAKQGWLGSAVCQLHAAWQGSQVWVAERMLDWMWSRSKATPEEEAKEDFDSQEEDFLSSESWQQQGADHQKQQQQHEHQYPGRNSTQSGLNGSNQIDDEAARAQQQKRRQMQGRAYGGGRYSDGVQMPDYDALMYQLRMPYSGSSGNALRPEVVESLFYLYRATGMRLYVENSVLKGTRTMMPGDPVYREWGWNMFRAYEKWSKMPGGGYSVMQDVNVIPPIPGNKMESFWLAETLKYFYLLFCEPDVIPLSQYVFNTEAHPLPIWGSEADKAVLATLSPATKNRLKHALDVYAGQMKKEDAATESAGIGRGRRVGRSSQR